MQSNKEILKISQIEKDKTATAILKETVQRKRDQNQNDHDTNSKQYLVSA